MGESVRNFAKEFSSDVDSGYKKMRLTFRMTCCAFVFLQILLAGRLIRSYVKQLILSCCKFVKLHLLSC